MSQNLPGQFKDWGTFVARARTAGPTEHAVWAARDAVGGDLFRPGLSHIGDLDEILPIAGFRERRA